MIAWWLAFERVCLFMSRSLNRPHSSHHTTCHHLAPGHRVLAGMGWQPGQGLQHGGGSGLVLPQLKWDKAGLGASTNVKLLGLGRTTFRRAGVAAGGMNDVADLQ